MAMQAAVALAALSRPRRTLVPQCVHMIAHLHGLSPAGRRQSVAGSHCGRSASNLDQGRHHGIPFIFSWLARQWVIGACRLPSSLCEAALHIERLVLLQDMETCAGELVSQGLARDGGVGPGLLAFIKRPGLSTVALREVGRLDERP
jgi:hypothetical protein